MFKPRFRAGMALFFLLLASGIAADGAQLREAQDLARQAGVYGYPLVVMDMTHRVMDATAITSGDTRPNHFTHVRAFPDPAFTSVVSPNADTLYSMAWVDLANSPVVLTVPEMGKRYYVMQFLGAWTDVFASVGSRTTGNGPGKFVIVGPGWRGELPGDATRIDSPTNLFWLIGRTQTNGKDDYDQVHAIQDSYGLASLHPEYDRPLERDPAVTPQPGPPDQVERLDAAAFFSRLNLLMLANPPQPADELLLATIKQIGIEPGKLFPPEGMAPEVRQAIEEGLRQALAEINTRSDPLGDMRGPWRILPKSVGRFGTDYALRATVARFGLGANLWDDAVYPTANHDDSGAPLDGANNYTVHFAAGKLPPVNAFWSLTVYNERQYFVDNRLDRYALGDRDPLRFDPDGGLTLFLRHEPPGQGEEANWLPTPNAPFNLILRLYWPQAAILDGTWPLPALKRVE